MQQLVILLIINCSSTCFGRLYAHHQEVRLCYTAYGFLCCCSCCDVGESDGKMCALSWGSCLTQVNQLPPRSAHILLLDSPVNQLPPHSAHILPPDSPVKRLPPRSAHFLPLDSPVKQLPPRSAHILPIDSPVKQLPPRSAHILPPDSPATKQLQQDRKP
jgi:hypothetical protein